MKKIITCLIVIFFIFSVSLVFVTANTKPTITLQDGVSIRDDANAGLKWKAYVENPNDTDTYGMLFGKGVFSLEQMNHQNIETLGLVDSVKANVIDDLKIDEKTGKQCFEVTMKNFPKSSVAQDITVIAYIYDGEKYTYSDNIVVRNLASVVVNAKNNNIEGDFINSVFDYVEDNYLKTFTDVQGNIYFTNPIYEYNHKVLAEIFINDWNEQFGTNLNSETAFAGGSSSPWYKSAKTSNQTDWTNSKLKAFFQNSEMYAKWGWLLEYIKTELSSGTGYSFAKKQIEAIVNNKADTANWYYGAHLCSYIMSVFEGAYASSGWGSFSFTANPYKLPSIINYNDVIKSQSNNSTFVKNTDTILLDAVPSRDGYASQWVNPNNSQVVDKIILNGSPYYVGVKYSKITYNITYYDGETLLDLNLKTFDVETKDTALPIPTKEGYKFVGWYDNKDFKGDAVTTIIKGSFGHKTFYAKFEKLSYVDVNVSFDLNGGTFMYNSADEAALDLVKDLSAFKNTTYTRETYSITKWGIKNIYKFFLDSKYRDKWQWLVEYWTVNAGDNPSSEDDVAPFKHLLAAMNDHASTPDATNHKWKSDWDPYAIDYEVCAFVNGNKNTLHSGCLTADYSNATILSKLSLAAKGKTTAIYNEPSTLPIPTKENAIFKGWKSSVEGSDLVLNYPGYFVSPGAITYTAVWQTIQNVSFDLNGGYWCEEEIIENYLGTPIRTDIINKYSSNYYGDYEGRILICDKASMPTPSVTKFSHRIGVKKVDGVYKIIQIIASGETTSYLSDVEYFVYGAESHSTINDFKKACSLGDILVFSKDITALSKGNVDLSVSLYDEVQYNEAKKQNHSFIFEGQLSLDYTVKHPTLKFIGWFDNPDGDGEKITTLTTSKTLYAIWSNYIVASYESNPLLTIDETLIINAEVIGKNYGTLVWESKNPDIVTVDQNGLVTALNIGDAVIYVYDSKDPSVNLHITISVIEEELKDVFNVIYEAHNDTVFVRNDLGIGAGTPAYYSDIYGSVSKILFNKPLNKNTTYYTTANQSAATYGTMSSIEFITVHYTGNMALGANAKANASYFATNGSSSIHYTTGNDGVFYCMDESKGAWHAGDSGALNQVGEFKWIPTGIAYDNCDLLKVEFTISNDFYYEINGHKTTVKMPNPWNYSERNTDHTLNADGTISSKDSYTGTKFKNRTPESFINDLGLPVTVINGQYYMGTTWWCYSQVHEGRICSTGGNRNSIGIESCVDEGSDLWLTWQTTAQLVADIMVRQNLDISRVKGHHFFSGKDCPQPMLENDLEIWYEFLELVEFEYKLLTLCNDYEIDFVSNNPDIIDENGRVINYPSRDTSVSYSVTLTNKNTKISHTATFFTLVPGMN